MIPETGLFSGSFAFFTIPAGVKTVRLLSRTSRPHDAVGAYIDDRRPLGVLVGRVMLSQGTNNDTLTRHLQSEPLDGWFPHESSNARWTAGNAILSLENSDPTKEGLLAVEILSSGPYIIENMTVPVERLTA